MKQICLFFMLIPFFVFSNAFLKIPGIEGDSLQMNHFNWFNIQEYKVGPVIWKQGMGYPPIQDRTTGKIKNGTVTVTFFAGPYNSDLESAWENDKRFNQVILDVQAFNMAPNRILKYTLSNVRISSITLEKKNKEESKSMQTMTLSFDEMEWGLTVTPQLKEQAYLQRR